MAASCLIVMFAPMVRFENVGMRYGSGPEVLRDVSFSLEPGSVHLPDRLVGGGQDQPAQIDLCRRTTQPRAHHLI